MKIGIDCRLWNETGVGRYIRNLVRELRELDTENEYVLFVRSVDYEKIKHSHFAKASRDGHGLKSKDGRWTLVKVDIRWHTLQEQFLFPKLLNKYNLDLVHFPYFSVPIRYKKPFVVTIHDLILHNYPTGQATTLPKPVYTAKLFGYRYIISQAAQKARTIIAVSNATKEEIIKHLHVPEGKIVVTYEGVDMQESKGKKPVRQPCLPAGRAQGKQEVSKELEEKKYFLYVGNAYPHKNLETLINGFQKLHASQKDTTLVLVGKEDYFYTRLKDQVAKLGLTEAVLFLGYVSDEALRTLYNNAQALVMSSKMEGFGLPVLEAMAHNCCVIASDIPSLREIAQDAAVYIDPNDQASMTHAMEQVITMKKEEKQALHAKGKKRVQQFSWKTMAKQTLAIYNSAQEHDQE